MTQVYQRSRIKIGILITTIIMGSSRVTSTGFVGSMKSTLSSPEFRKTAAYVAAPFAIYTAGNYLLSSRISEKSPALKKIIGTYGEPLLCGLTLFCAGKVAHQYGYVSNAVAETLLFTGLAAGTTLSLISSTKSDLSTRTVGSRVEMPTTTTSDYIGSIPEDVRELMRYLQDPAIRLRYKYHNLTPPRGILLYGSPGTGKTHLIRHIARSVQIPFIRTSLQELTHGLVGATEDNIKEIFTRTRTAAKNSPQGVALLFIDEIDALMPVRSKRDTDLSHHNNSVSSILLELLDGLIKDSDSHVVVIGCTNRKDAIDEAFVRPGRLEKHIHLPLPDPATCKQLLQYHITKYGRCAPQNDLVDGFANNLKGTSPADINDAVHSAVCRLANHGKIVNTKTILATICKQQLLKKLNNASIRNNNSRRKSF